MDTQTKVIADNRINSIIRSYKTDDHILYLYGIDNIICGIVNSKSFSYPLFKNIVPIGITIIGVIAIYNENTTEDFEEILNGEIDKIQFDILKNSDDGSLLALAIKDVLYLDDNDPLTFDIQNINGNEIELEFVDDLLSHIKDTHYLFKTDIKLSFGDNSDKGYELRSSDIDSLKEMPLIITIKDDKQQLMIDNVGHLTNENCKHLSQFIEKIDLITLKKEELKCINFSFGIKTNNDDPQSIEIIKNSEMNIKQVCCISIGSIGIINHINNSYNEILTKMYQRLIENIKICLESLRSGKDLIQGIGAYNYLLNCIPLHLTQITKIINDDNTISLTEESKLREENEIQSKYHIKGISLFNSNPIIMTTKKYQSSKLVNLHLQITKPIPNNTIRACVKGYYEYFHYCHDGVQDSGWGCAYRSLQTLFSWFLLNTDLGRNKTVPSLQDIQTTLVTNGDKQKELIGSMDWIGAYEVSIVLNELLKIESKIIYISSGEELHSKGRELIYHFQHEGTPVMIGGGKYAYTILGVDYDRVQGKCEFLILDPHYGGEDTPKHLLDKGWCGWKSISLFQKENFYNMCMPLIP